VSEDRHHPVDGVTQAMIVDALRLKTLDAKNLVQFVKRFPPDDYNGRVAGFPITCTKEAWDAAKAAGFLKPMNVTVRDTAELIAKHYAIKDTHYIQIGGLGLFHMGANPLRLPVPRLVGDVGVELRLAHHGAKPNREVGERVTADLRAQARLLTRAKSPWSLDNRDHVLMLFGPGTGRH